MPSNTSVPCPLCAISKLRFETAGQGARPAVDSAGDNDCASRFASTRPFNSSLWQNHELRVIDAAEPGFPGLTRVIWHEHIAEMTQLDLAQRRRFMDVVWIVEQTLREQFEPHKINLAQLGNQVPHLHWHVMPRWTFDSHYPQAIWAPAPPRDPRQHQSWTQFQAQLAERLPGYHAALRQALGA